jgi:integrase
MDRWGWDQLAPYLEIRATLPVGGLFCVIHGPTAGRRWEASAARKQLRRAAEAAGVRRRFAPHQLRHAEAIELAHEGVPLLVIQRQLGLTTESTRPAKRSSRGCPPRVSRCFGLRQSKVSRAQSIKGF